MLSQPENAELLLTRMIITLLSLCIALLPKPRRRGPLPGTVELLVEENDIARSIATFDLEEMITEEQPIYLRLSKSGATYRAYYSLNGKDFQLLGSAESLLRDIKVGLIACDGIITQSMTSTFWFDSDTTKPETPYNVSFDYFHIKNDGITLDK